ncbi:hypothetical protein AVEN_64509-1 [Araneus ventricosus]|uniref:Uncharacterized protein n=1 Tax=Araneus ventricosus TaxID=182803 RepID=A0A4Y2N734_ARAVE|nr:hypothetical protein AVEN_64509-1 [Araneus ventricosus]
MLACLPPPSFSFFAPSVPPSPTSKGSITLSQNTGLFKTIPPTTTQITKKVEEKLPFPFHRLSAKEFLHKPFRKPLPQGLHRKAFYEIPHRQGLNDKSAKAFPHKPFRKPFPQN